MFKILTLGALAMAAQATAINSDWTWNEVVGADVELFDGDVASIRLQSHHPDTNAALLNQLSELLGQEDVFNGIYNKYLNDYKKDSSRSLDSARQALFRESLINMAEHNLQAAEGKFSYTQGINQFSDMSDEEYLSYLTYNESDSQFDSQDENVSSALGRNYESISWRGQLTAVKNQGRCGSCYAFAVVGQLEAHHVINGGAALDLSEQQVVDCSRGHVNGGCRGGSSQVTAEFLKKGVSLEREYPYTAKDGKCNPNAKPAGPKVLSYQVSRSDAGLKGGLQTGPVVVAVAASCSGFKNYKSGTLRDCLGTLNHAVLAFGYKKDESYYEVKNSWGPRWGDSGFIKIGAHVAGIGTRNVAITSN